MTCFVNMVFGVVEVVKVVTRDCVVYPIKVQHPLVEKLRE